MKKSFIAVGLAALTLVAACGPSQDVRQKLNQLAVVSAEKDSLLSIVTENTRLMSEISMELVKVTPGRDRLAVAGESPYQVNRDSLRAMVRSVTERIEESEERLARSERRIRNLSNVSDSLRQQIETWQTVMEDLHETIDNQKETLVSLNERVQQLETRNVQLAAEKAAVQDTLRNVEGEFNTAYYVVGTRDELKERGIIVEEGGTRFPLLFTRVGETLKPATTLDSTMFQSIDIRQTTEITLPGNREYEIVSTQNLAALATEARGGKIRGDTLRIANPREFWSQSRYLILVRG